MAARSLPISEPDRTRRRRVRRKRDLVDFALFSSVRSQCSLAKHESEAFCTTRNCHFLNLECLEKLLRSARKSICVAMYQFSVRSLHDAIVHAMEKHKVSVRVIVDSKMRQNQGAVFQDMVANDINIKWQKPAANMACLMHNKFVLIDAEPTPSDWSSDDEDAEEEALSDLCAKCKSAASDCDGDLSSSDRNMASEESNANAPTLCVQCRPVRILSKKDLVQWPSDSLSRLPKHGLLITGSWNWSTQAFRENYENCSITSNPRQITQFLEQFNWLWKDGLKETYTYGERRSKEVNGRRN